MGEGNQGYRRYAEIRAGYSESEGCIAGHIFQAGHGKYS